MKVKRIKAITNATGIIKSVLDRRATRIDRQVSQAIDSAKDEADLVSEQIEDCINHLGACASSDDRSALEMALNAYIDKCAELDSINRTLGYLENLKVKLHEEIEVVNE